MIKRLFEFFFCLVFSVSVLSGIMFGVDYYRCADLKTPVFAVGLHTADDGGSGTYHGPGYTITVDGELTMEYGYVVHSVEMYALGQFVFGAIT